jgi:peptide-methionine (R)-S-oxide reductase
MDDNLKSKLTPEQRRVLCDAGTEAPFSGKYVNYHEDGTYLCAACSTPLFSSETKFESGSGWPSFYDVLSKGNVELKEDRSHGMTRTEVVCATCGGHLGHVFDDGPKDKGGLRYCINSASLDFTEKKRG